MIGLQAFAQGSICANIEPFCAGNQRLTFPNSNSFNSTQVSGEFGPDYGCLLEQPFPAWFFLQIEDGGNLRFKISQNSRADGRGAPLDVDFVVWGPFERGEDYCNVNSLTEQNQVDCSYLPDATETMIIPNAQQDEIYVVMITNFEEVPGFISLEQTNTGEGSTDCSILDFDLGEDVAVCDDTSYVLDGTINAEAEYQWFRYNELTMSYEKLESETQSTLEVIENGNYKLIVTDKLEGKTEEDDIDVTFFDSPEIFITEELANCNGTGFVDLNRTSFQLLGALAEDPRYMVNYYENIQDAEGNEFITNPGNYPFVNGKKIYARTVDTVSGCLSNTVSYELTTFDFANYELEEQTILCVDLAGIAMGSVLLGEDLGEGYSYEWILDGEVVSTNAKFTIETVPDNAELTQNVFHLDSGCFQSFVTTIQAVSRPENLQVDITGTDFGDGYVVSLQTTGGVGQQFAGYEYRLDDGNWSSSPRFKNVKPGEHIAMVREINGCGVTQSASFFLVGYPRFFTPNGDGFNDSWQLITDESIQIFEVMIFDRYGKLIVVLKKDTNFSWDGTYNGINLPQTDYWFKVVFSLDKGRTQEYMSNFSLIR